MRKITLSDLERQTLKEGVKNHPKSHVRNRFQALLWSDEGMKVKEIAQLLKVRTRTIYTWMNRWEERGIIGLFILPGRGLKPTLDEKVEEIVETVKKKLAYLHAV